jgi:hypothetical protein
MTNSKTTKKKVENIIIFVKKYWVILVIFVGVPIVLVFGYFYTKLAFAELSYLQRENTKYTLVKSSDEVKGVILSTYFDHGTVFVKLIDSSKICFEASQNKMYEKHWLGDFLQGYDSIVKHSNSDTLFIYRQRKTYFFRLGHFD